MPTPADVAEIARLTLQMPRDTHDELVGLASASHRTLSGEIRLAIREHLDAAADRQEG